MRLQPVVGGVIGKEALQDVDINGISIPKGTILAASVSAVHTHPDNWDRPDDFMPVRPLALMEIWTFLA